MINQAFVLKNNHFEHIYIIDCDYHLKRFMANFCVAYDMFRNYSRKTMIEQHTTHIKFDEKTTENFCKMV